MIRICLALAICAMGLSAQAQGRDLSALARVEMAQTRIDDISGGLRVRPWRRGQHRHGAVRRL